MTTPTADQATEILASVGDFAGGFLAANLDYVWAKYDLIGGRLQLLYTKRDLIDMAISPSPGNSSPQAARRSPVSRVSLM
jgi:hypothetical protein